MSYNILLVGKGGQGIITISNILAYAAIKKDLRAIVTQKKGLAQRGGSVVAQVRIGEVYSPQIPKFSSDSLISLDLEETFKYLDYLNKDTVLIINTKLTFDNDESCLTENEKSKIALLSKLQESLKENLFLVDADSVAKEEEYERSANIFLLGVLFGLDSRIKSLLTNIDIVDSIKKNISRDTEANQKIFTKGTKL